MPNLEAGFLILNEWIPAFRSLSGDECKELLFALIDRQQNGTPVPSFEGIMGIYAQMIEPTIKRRLDGQRGGRKGTTIGTMQGTTIGTTIGTSEARREKKSIDNTLSDERVNAHTRARDKKSTFTPPTVDEVRAYCAERGNSVDAERFVDHYTSNGWRVGGKGSMKDWKAAIRNWEKNEGVFARSEERGDGVSAGGSFDTDEFFNAALARSYDEDVG